MTFQATFWAAAAAAFFLVVGAGLADGRRNRRTDLDASGWVPWRGVQVAGIFLVMLFAILAFKLG